MVNYKLRDINSKQVATLLEEIVNQSIAHGPNSIVKCNNGLRAFGVYTIIDSHNCYKIYKNKNFITEIGSIKSAISWCIADKFHNCVLANNIKRYDLELSWRQNEILHYKHVLHSDQKTNNKTIISDRLYESQLRAKSIKNQLSKCFNSAKYCQLKGFENETSRLGLKTSSRKISKGI